MPKQRPTHRVWGARGRPLPAVCYSRRDLRLRYSVVRNDRGIEGSGIACPIVCSCGLV